MLALVAVTRGHARAQENGTTPPPPQQDRLAGTYLLSSVGLIVPPMGGALGVAGDLELAYAFALGGVAVGPGLRVAGYLGADASVLLGLATLRCLLPLSLAIPYLSVGVGPAYGSTPDSLELAVQAGGGLLFAITPRLAVGGEANYLQLGSGAFKQVYLGPALRLAL